MADTAISIEALKPIRELVYDYLRDAIGSGEIAAGERLNESELAAKLNVSRTPVREAVRMLESDGLVQAVPRRGVIVHDFDISEIIEIYMIRQALEVLAIKSAARRATSEEISKMREYLRESEACLAKGNYEGYFEVTELFTNAVIEAGKMPRVTQLISTYREHLKRYRKITLSDATRRSEAVSQHFAILDAVESRDAELVGRLVFEHLEGAMDVFRRIHKKG
ncbi:GntR family transcriptional regulator [Synergistales bacterium]|nr:GntR family transcriptional regulator [Synergistales bacterium]